MIVFMPHSQNSIIVQRCKAVKAIRCAGSFRYRTVFGRKLAALGYLHDRVFQKMARIVAKPLNANIYPVGKSQRCIFRRPSVFRTRIGVLFLFAFAVALAFFTSAPADSAQHPAGAAAQSQPGSAVASGAAVSPTA